MAGFQSWTSLTERADVGLWTRSLMGSIIGSGWMIPQMEVSMGVMKLLLISSYASKPPVAGVTQLYDVEKTRKLGKRHRRRALRC